MALIGRTGQRFSHAPQPMQRSLSTIGIRMDSLSLASEGIILIAPTGHLRAQLPHSTPSARGKQSSLFHTAVPIFVEDFSTRVIGVIAPAGQTCEHLVHSGRQKPRSYDITGCKRFVSSDEGRKTPLGHLLTHS